jgi:hypothetical protein
MPYNHPLRTWQRNGCTNHAKWRAILFIHGQLLLTVTTRAGQNTRGQLGSTRLVSILSRAELASQLGLLTS